MVSSQVSDDYQSPSSKLRFKMPLKKSSADEDESLRSEAIDRGPSSYDRKPHISLQTNLVRNKNGSSRNNSKISLVSMCKLIS